MCSRTASRRTSVACRFGDQAVKGTGVDLGGYGIEGGLDVADAVVGVEILYGLGVVGGVLLATDSGLALGFPGHDTRRCQ